MNFVEVTGRLDGQKFSVNLENVSFIVKSDEGGVNIYFPGDNSFLAIAEDYEVLKKTLAQLQKI